MPRHFKRINVVIGIHAHMRAHTHTHKRARQFGIKEVSELLALEYFPVIANNILLCVANAAGLAAEILARTC